MAESSPLRIEDVEGVTCVRFRDASILDSATIQVISGELTQMIEKPEHRRLVLDFGEVRFLASQALGMLLGLRNKAQKQGAQLALAGVRPEIARLFKLAGIEKMFKLYNSSEDARSKLQ